MRSQAELVSTQVEGCVLFTTSFTTACRVQRQALVQETELSRDAVTACIYAELVSIECWKECVIQLTTSMQTSHLLAGFPLTFSHFANAASRPGVLTSPLEGVQLLQA